MVIRIVEFIIVFLAICILLVYIIRKNKGNSIIKILSIITLIEILVGIAFQLYYQLIMKGITFQNVILFKEIDSILYVIRLVLILSISVILLVQSINKKSIKRV